MAEELLRVRVIVEVDTNKRTLTFSEKHDDIPAALEAAREWADGLLD